MEGLHYAVAVVGIGVCVLGAALGMGRFVSAAAEGIARQPGAADKVMGAVLLPMFLIEGLAIIGAIAGLLVILLK